MRLLDGATVRPYGETALVVEFGDTISPELHDRVLAAEQAVAGAQIEGVEELVPSYRSLLVRIDPLTTSPDAVEQVLRHSSDVAAPILPRTHEVEVSFAPGDAEDLTAFARAAGLPPDQVVALLTRDPLRLYMYGFAPGFGYLGGLPAPLHVPRRATPRAPVTPGSLIVAAGQAALCPVAMPTGWYVLGRTRAPLFDPGSEPPVAWDVGDHVHLVATAGVP